jgi:WXXGXW repeat (2 copies)
MHIRSVRTLLLGLVILCTSAAAFAQIGVMITIAPPAIPVYEQPICPGDGYIWTPGYWAWGDDFNDYYWVPGTWIEAPEVGFLWTPGYWGWNADRFVFTDGYWGPHVGFYGGINYGFGYFGSGYEGGRWDNGHFFYNRAVTRVNVTVIHNVYNTKVVENERTRISYNGGNGGINARPTPEQETAVRERHVPPVAAQTQHLQAARSNNQQRAAVNRGKPEVAATAKLLRPTVGGISRAKTPPPRVRTITAMPVGPTQRFIPATFPPPPGRPLPTPAMPSWIRSTSSSRKSSQPSRTRNGRSFNRNRRKSISS